MTTKLKIEPPSANQVREIPLDLLDSNPRNPRKTFDALALGELAASIKSIGFTQPLLVRPTPQLDGLVEMRYEIVCGHRRVEAADMLGLESAPCTVRSLSDEEAADIAIVDNLQRADVPALEEADSYEALRQRLGTAEAIAARVSKPVEYVAKRLRLVSLGEHSRRALAAQLITVDHALLLARLGSEEENAALKWTLDHNAGVKVKIEAVIAAAIERREEERKEKSHWRNTWEPMSVQRLKEHIERSSGRKLSRAPWSLDDAELVPAVGACTVCPSITKANASLFSDLDIEEATCADGLCFESKRAAFVQLQTRKAIAPEDEQLPLRVSWKSTAVKPRMTKDGSGPVLSQIFKYGQWLDVKKDSCIYMRKGVTVDWSDAGDRGYLRNGRKVRNPGEVLLVCVAEKCKAHPKGWEKAQGWPPAMLRAMKPREKAAQEKRKEEAVEESKLRMAVAAKAIEGVTKLPVDALRALAIDSLADWADDRKYHEALVPGIAKILGEAKADSVPFFRALAAASIDMGLLAADEWRPAKEGRGDFLAAVKRLGYDGSSAWLKPAKPKAKFAKLPGKKSVKTAAAKKAAKRK
jgi:ParB/RepB/Spo0J family partition protein